MTGSLLLFLWHGFISLCLLNHCINSTTNVTFYRELASTDLALSELHENTRSSIECSILCSKRNLDRSNGNEPCAAYNYEATYKKCQFYAVVHAATTALDVPVYGCKIPGDWSPWSEWTIGMGGKHRSRVCDVDSYGDRTTPCEGHDEEDVTCPTNDCSTLPRTCTEWKELGLTVSSDVNIDPDGPGGSTFDPFKVTCDMEGKDGAGITRMGHKNQGQTHVTNYEAPGEYKLELEYYIGFEQMISVIDQSAKCRQFLMWNCYHAKVNDYYGTVYTGWINRRDEKADYFAGGKRGFKNCLCGKKGNCANPGYRCNCDSNDYTWRSDSGYVYSSQDLPIVAFYAGDTGQSFEDGYHTIGPLECWGHSNK